MHHDFASSSPKRPVGEYAWSWVGLLLCLAVGAAILSPGRTLNAEDLPQAVPPAPGLAAAPSHSMALASEPDWAQIEASPDVSPMSVAAYER